MSTPDITKAISSNDIKNGASLLLVNKTGIEVLFDGSRDTEQGLEALAPETTDRFDDREYYLPLTSSPGTSSTDTLDNVTDRGAITTNGITVSSLTLSQGSKISETNNTISLAPPTAASGQSLVIRPTAASEQSHVHLVAGNPSTVDIYLGDDDQYVKIEKDGGDVVIGTQETLTTNNIYTNGADFSTDVDLGMGTGIIAGWYQRTASQIEFALFGDSTFQSYLTGLALGRTVIVTYTNGATPSGTATLTATLTQTFGSTGQADPNNPTRSRVSGRIDAILPTVVGELSIVSINFPVYSTNTNNWAFGTDGKLTLPGGSAQVVVEGDYGVRIGTAGTNVAPNSQIKIGGAQHALEIFGGPPGYSWKFNTNGGLTFPNNTTQTSAGIPSNTGLVPNSVSITNMVSISQANYDAIVTKNSSTLYVIS